MSNAEFHKVTVVGAGPAGIAAAIQLTRYGIKPVVFEGNVIGGLVHNANRVENYPGFPKGIHGHHLAELFTEQLVEANIEVQKETVLSIAYQRCFPYYYRPSVIDKPNCIARNRYTASSQLHSGCSECKGKTSLL